VRSSNPEEVDMRRIGILAAFALVLAVVPAGATGIGVGVFGGASIPVVNDLSDQGSIYGIRVPVSFSPGLSAEAFYAQSALGDVTEDFGGGITGTRDGGDMKSLGANLVFGMGAPTLSFHTIVGIGSYKLEREGSEDIKKAGYTLGLGLGIAPTGLMGLTFDVRGEFVMIPTDETSQKFGNVTAGVTYKFFTTP
jgi:opacity protein-like surface antigen